MPITGMLVMPDFSQPGLLAVIQLSAAGQTGLVVALVLYFVGLLAVSIYAAKNVKTEQDFLVAGRRLPLHLSWGALMATWFGSSAIMGATKNSFESGVSGTILDPFACSATLLFTGLVFAAGCGACNSLQWPTSTCKSMAPKPSSSRV